MFYELVLGYVASLSISVVFFPNRVLITGSLTVDLIYFLPSVGL